jgi:hypothetical protein
VIHQDQVTALHLTTGHHGPVTDDSSRAAWLSGARSYLRDADPVLARLIDDRPDFDPRAWISELPAMDQSWSLMQNIGNLPIAAPSAKKSGRFSTRRAT